LFMLRSLELHIESMVCKILKRASTKIAGGLKFAQENTDSDLVKATGEALSAVLPGRIHREP
jgi:hypothetical protein